MILFYLSGLLAGVYLAFFVWPDLKRMFEDYVAGLVKEATR